MWKVKEWKQKVEANVLLSLKDHKKTKLIKSDLE